MDMEDPASCGNGIYDEKHCEVYLRRIALHLRHGRFGYIRNVIDVAEKELPNTVVAPDIDSHLADLLDWQSGGRTPGLGIASILENRLGVVFVSDLLIYTKADLMRLTGINEVTTNRIQSQLLKIGIVWE